MSYKSFKVDQAFRKPCPMSKGLSSYTVTKIYVMHILYLNKKYEYSIATYAGYMCVHLKMMNRFINISVYFFLQLHFTRLI